MGRIIEPFLHCPPRIGNLAEVDGVARAEKLAPRVTVIVDEGSNVFEPDGRLI